MCQKSCACVGIWITLVTFIVAAAALTLAVWQFPVVYVTWSDKVYTSLGPTQITAGVLAVFTSIIGLFVFSYCKHPPQFDKSFGGLLVISFLFSYGIGIFGVVGVILKGKISKAVGCDTKIKGLLTIWKNIDELFILANSLVCSPLCKCEMTYDLENSFQTHRFAYDLIDTLDPETDYTRVESPRYFSIEYCDKSAQKQIELMFKSNPNNTLRDLNYRKFRHYWKKMEERFECSGWCTTSYTNVFTLKKQHTFKYAFSDLNQGVVKYPGCLNRILYYVCVLTAIISSLLLLSAALQTATFIILCYSMKETYKKMELLKKQKDDEAKIELKEKKK